MSFINSCLAGMAFSFLRDTFSHFMGEKSEFSMGFDFPGALVLVNTTGN